MTDITTPASFVPVAYADLVGFVNAAGHPIARLGDNANWLIGRHCPPVVYTCPPEHLTLDAMHVVPIAPSADGLDYEVWLGVLGGGAGASMTWRVAWSSAAAPQPATAGDWTTIGSYTDTLTAAERDWVLADTVTIPATATHLRIEQAGTSGLAAVTTILVRPAQRAAIPRAAPASGAVPWDVGMAFDGGPVTPEHLNRIWRTTGAVLADRVQAVAAWSQSNELPLLVSLTTAQPFIPIARIPAWLEGQGGCKVTLRIGALATAAGCTITVGQAGGASHTFTIPHPVATYTYQSAQITLTHEAPVFYALVGGPDGADVAVLYITADWRPGD